jgi:hypothetical protein
MMKTTKWSSVGRKMLMAFSFRESSYQHPCILAYRIEHR